MILLSISGFFEYAVITMTGILVIVNPLTTAFVFMAFLPDATKEEKKAVAKKSVLIATGVFFVFALAGSIIFQLFGITLSAFRIAGGIILFGIAMGMLQKKEEHEGIPKKKTGPGDDIAIIPLAIPFMSGPGSIATVMILTSEAPTIYHTLIVFVAVVITTSLCYFAMVNSGYLVKILGETGKQIVTRLFGLILAVISVQFVINGILEVVNEYFK